ncbi:(2Fe-2S)-binding protein [Sulfuriferula plumbiphila]|uniref:(2Fe-2S)-binding protein n=1 Tax=Sulfuriferula plumbiphila TaxID=171865 RepID=A0A512LDG3_9PROT|nr:Rieske 2Fe-2S domain-containing protein [Sulfuriferula plumbiphila]BBP04911.1 (2Fe-2S)-binding protein [Sulfuriferula plumbiphila]GEP32171.1 (2Fe-2S)-binding protein [Sulfuriferula plumbiphila]
MVACFSKQAQATELTSFARVKLVDAQGQPIKASALGSAEAYLFNYPYASTPSFLINLGKPAPDGNKLVASDGNEYAWRGGVGANKSVVAYTAICAHQLAYPTRDASLITYNPNTSEIAGRGGVITCCAHNSVYDPAQGARVLSGPAAGPLSAVALEYDVATDELYATGVYGGTLFDDFFKAYKTQLNAELGAGKARELVTAMAKVVPFAEYSKVRVQC